MMRVVFFFFKPACLFDKAPISTEISSFVNLSELCLFLCLQLLFMNLVLKKFVYIPKDTVTTSKEIPAGKWP